MYEFIIEVAVFGEIKATLTRHPFEEIKGRFFFRTTDLNQGLQEVSGILSKAGLLAPESVTITWRAVREGSGTETVVFYPRYIVWVQQTPFVVEGDKDYIYLADDCDAFATKTIHFADTLAEASRIVLEHVARYPNGWGADALLIEGGEPFASINRAGEVRTIKPNGEGEPQVLHTPPKALMVIEGGE